jgi:hypothetical protein
MDIIYFTFISHPTRKQYNLQEEEEEEEEEIEAWFCLIFSAKCSDLTFQFHVFLHNTNIQKMITSPSIAKSRLEDHMPVAY